MEEAALVGRVASRAVEDLAGVIPALMISHANVS